MMLSNILTKSLFDMRRGLLIWALALLLLNVWIVTLYPAIESSFTLLDEYMQNLPASFTVFVGEVQSMSTLEGFLAIELFNLFLPVLSVAFAVAYGSGAIGAEEQSHTLDLLLAHPVPRWRVLIEKYASIVIFTSLVLLAGYLGILIGTVVVDVTIDPGNTAMATFELILLTLVFGTLALGLTGLGLGRGAAAGLTAGLAGITYLLNGLAPIADLPEIAQTLSPWHYYDSGTTLLEGTDPQNLAILTALILAFLAVGLIAFQRRDIAS